MALALKRRVLWNAILLIYSTIAAAFAIQHQMFFYSFPPNVAARVNVPLLAYLLLAFIIFVGFKAVLWIGEEAQIFHDMQLEGGDTE